MVVVVSVKFDVTWHPPARGTEHEVLRVYASLPRGWRHVGTSFNSQSRTFLLSRKTPVFVQVSGQAAQRTAADGTADAPPYVDFVVMGRDQTEDGHLVWSHVGQMRVAHARLLSDAAEDGHYHEVTIEDLRGRGRGSVSATSPGVLRVFHTTITATSDDDARVGSDRSGAAATGAASADSDMRRTLGVAAELRSKVRSAGQYPGVNRWIDALDANEYDTGLRMEDGSDMVLPLVAYWDASHAVASQAYYDNALQIVTARAGMKPTDVPRLLTRARSGDSGAALDVAQLYVRLLCATTTTRHYVYDYLRDTRDLKKHADAELFLNEDICHCGDCEDGTRSIMKTEYLVLRTRWRSKPMQAMQAVAQQLVVMASLSLVTNPSMAAYERARLAGDPNARAPSSRTPVAGHMYATVLPVGAVADMIELGTGGTPDNSNSDATGSAGSGVDSGSMAARAQAVRKRADELANAWRPQGASLDERVKVEAWASDLPLLVAESTAMASPLPVCAAEYERSPTRKRQVLQEIKMRERAMVYLYKKTEGTLSLLVTDTVPTDLAPEAARDFARPNTSDEINTMQRRASQFYRRVKTFSSMRPGIGTLGALEPGTAALGASFESLVFRTRDVPLVPIHTIDGAVGDFTRKVHDCNNQLPAEVTLIAPTNLQQSALPDKTRLHLDRLVRESRTRTGTSAAMGARTRVTLFSHYDYLRPDPGDVHTLAHVLEDVLRDERVSDFTYTEERLSGEDALVRLDLMVQM